jgi:hypothetical protein
MDIPSNEAPTLYWSIKATTGCTGDAISAPLLNIVSCLESLVHLSDVVQRPVDTHVSWQCTVEFEQHALHFIPRENYQRYFRSSVGELPVTLHYGIPYSEGLPLNPAVPGLRPTMSFHSRRCPASSRTDPTTGSLNCPPRLAVGFQPPVATAAIACAYWCLPAPRLFDSKCTLRCMALGKVHRNRCASGPGAAFLETLDPAGRMPHKVPEAHMSKVRAEWSCPYRYLWKCSSALTMANSSRRVVQ